MTTQIQLNAFNFKSSFVRIITDPNQEHWFCGSDVCNILGYTNSRKALQDHCKPKGVTKRYTLTEKGNQELTFINEPNLYRLIIKSRKPEAENFEAWVFEEVLPQIRKTGKYSQNNQQIRPLVPPPKKYAFELTEDELLDLAWAWFAFIRGIHTFRHIYPVFEKLGSNMAGNIYGQGFEYTTTARNAHKVINRLTKDFQYDYDSNWRVLKHIRSFDPTFKQPTF